MKTIIINLFFFIVTQILTAQSKNICFTIDDLPVVSYGINDTTFQQNLMNGIIQSLMKHNIPAIGFVNEMKLYKNDSILAKQIGKDYIDYMERKLVYFENQSQKLFGKNINHILLMHASWLNSDFIDSLAVMLKNNNYNFISLDETLKDGLYKTPITKFGNWGISWLDIWALSQNKKSEFFQDDPQTPEYIKKLAE